MKKMMALLLALVLVLAMAACAKQPTPTEPSEDASQPTEGTQATEATQATEEDDAMTPAEMAAYDGKVVFQVERIGTLKNDGDFGVAQGACTDGKYIYMILENQNVDAEGGYKKNSHYCKIAKIDPATMETVKLSEPLLVDHGNDMTYNSKTNQLLVVHNSPNLTYVSYVNPDTLELIETVKDNDVKMYALAYNPVTDQYVAGLSNCYDFAILDSNLKMVQRFDGKDTGWTKQGVECDENYIYFVHYKSDALIVYDWNGNHIKTVRMYLTRFGAQEPEALMLLDGKFIMTSYIGGKGGGVIFSGKFVEG